MSNKARRIEQAKANINLERTLDLIEQRHGRRYSTGNIERARYWAEKHLRKRGMQAVRDEISSSNLIIKRAVEFGNVDEDTLVAAVLYPSLRSHSDNPVDRSGLQEIEDKFGKRVAKVVQNTLSVRAIWHLPLQPGAQQSFEQQRARYLCMVSEVADLEVAPIYLRNIQKSINYDNMNPKNLTERRRFDEVSQGRNIYGPLAAICGHGALYEYIRECCFRLEDPVGYQETKQKIGQKMPDRRLEAIRDVISRTVLRTGISETDFELVVSKKPAASVNETSHRKEKTIDEMPDIGRFRLIVLNSAHDGKGDLATNLQGKLRRFQADITRQHGRGNREFASYYEELNRIEAAQKYRLRTREYTDELRRRLEGNLETSDLVKPNLPEIATGIDKARYKDYYKNPKANQYMAVHDVFHFIVDGQVYRLEGQLVDETTHQRNTRGPEINHALGYRENLITLASLHETLAYGSKAAKAQRETYVYNHFQEIFALPRDVTTLFDFAKQTIGPGARNLKSAVIQNPDPFARDGLEYTGQIESSASRFRPDAPLRSGDKILDFAFS